MIKADLAEALKKITSITEVSKALDCSRPTLYRYIELFENEEYGQLPPKVRTYFESILSEQISRRESEAYLNSIMMERKNLEMQARACDEEEFSLTRQLEKLRPMLKEHPEDEKIRSEVEALSNKRFELHEKHKMLTDALDELSMQFRSKANAVEQTIKESRENGPDWIDDEIEHICTGNNGNFLIIYGKPDADAKAYVELYARIAGNDEFLGRYEPEQGKNFIQISGLPNTLTYSYRLVLIDDEGKRCTELQKLNTR